MKAIFVKEYTKHSKPFILVVYQDGTIEEYEPGSGQRAVNMLQESQFGFLFWILAMLCCLGTIPFALITALVVKIVYG